MHRVPENILAVITPDQVKAFLRARGFAETASRREGWSIMSRDGCSFVVPNDSELIGYADTISSIVESFTTTDITYDEVLYQVFEPNSELMTHRLADLESTSGTATLGTVMKVIKGYYEVIKENAKYVARGVLAARVVQRGKEYSRSCRLGQTDYGSFILKFILPSGTPIVGPQGEQRTFGYEVTSLLEETFAFFAREDCVDVDVQQNKPPSLNRKVVEAISTISPTASLGAVSEVHFRHADTMFVETRQRVEAPVTRMDSLYFDRIERVRQQFVRAESFQRDVYKCYITDLHKDSPTERPPSAVRTGDEWVPPPKEHKITVELRTGTSRRKLRLVLLPAEYKEAVRWHDEEIPLRIDATIDKRTSNWNVSELHELTPLPTTGRSLF